MSENMSAGEGAEAETALCPLQQKLFYEGFLKKRKDKMILRWISYWFRLHNTTLFFFTKRHGNASHLRGQYYICTVQSVREVKTSDSKRYPFEINMKNGKRKVLAADTGELRQKWVEHLWSAMQLCRPDHNRYVPGSQSVLDLKPRARSSPCDSSSVDVRSAVVLQRCSSIPDGWSWTLSIQEPSVQHSAPSVVHCPASHSTTHADYPTLTSDHRSSLSNRPSSVVEAGCHQNVQRISSEEDTDQENETEGEDNDYDELPAPRKCDNVHQHNLNLPATDSEEQVYDTPLSNMGSNDEQHECQEFTESIYDVPKSLLRRKSETMVAEDDSDGENVLE